MNIRQQAMIGAVLLAVPVAATLAADAMRPIIEEIHNARTPEAATAAFEYGQTRDRLHLGLLNAYMDRMLQLGHPEEAYPAARLLAHVTEGNGVAWAVVAWHHMEAKEYYDAFLAVLKAGPLLPDSELVQRLAGRLMAWRDALGDRLYLSPSHRARSATMRELLGESAAFRRAYNEVRTEVARLKAETPDITPPRVATTTVATGARSVDSALSVRASGRSGSVNWSLAWNAVRPVSTSNVRYRVSGVTFGPLVTGTFRSFYIPTRHYVHHGHHGHGRRRPVSFFAATPEAARELRKIARAHGGSLPNVTGILVPPQTDGDDNRGRNHGRPPVRRALDARRPQSFSSHRQPGRISNGLLRPGVAGPSRRGAGRLSIGNLPPAAAPSPSEPTNPFRAARSKTRAPTRVNVNGNIHVR